jgi:hypothetical protein
MIFNRPDIIVISRRKSGAGRNMHSATVGRFIYTTIIDAERLKIPCISQALFSLLLAIASPTFQPHNSGPRQLVQFTPVSGYALQLLRTHHAIYHHASPSPDLYFPIDGFVYLSD